WHRFRGDVFLSGRTPAVVPGKFVPVWNSPPQAYAVRGQVQHKGWVYTVQDGTGAKGGYCSAYDAFTGAAGPIVQPTAESIDASPVISPDDVLYFAQRSGAGKTSLFSYLLPSLTLRWSYQMNSSNGFEAVKLSPAFMGNGFLFLGNDYGDFRGIFTGSLPATPWIFPEAINSQAGGAAVLMNGDVVYVVKRAIANVVCLTADGAIRWTQTLAGTPSALPYASPVAVRPDGRILVAVNDLNLLDPVSGVVAWTTPMTPAPTGIAVDADGTAYVSRGTVVSAVNAGGSILWTTTVGGGAATEIAPPVIAGGNRVVVSCKLGTTDDGVQLLRASDGAFLWDWRAGLGSVFANNLTSPIVTPEGWMYFSADNETFGFSVPPVLSLHKRGDVPVACAGTVVTYTVSWSNSTAMTAATFAIYDTLPNGTAYSKPSLVVRAPAGATVTPMFSAVLGGAWLAGEPADGTPGPLILRWVVSPVGRFASGELMYAVRISATLIAGGLVLFVIAINDIVTFDRKTRQVDHDSLGAVPLGVPMIV
ncbi:MAG: PQQ-binding-like beta-propeller repeat protein, partial [bacterium]